MGKNQDESANFFVCEKRSKSLVAWYLDNQRKLPWRTHRSLYGTILSEFMLQQTQVKTVIPYYERWLKRFPSIKAVAESSPEEVLKYWEGLGYYSRVRNLHEVCRRLTEEKKIPQTIDEWEKLPGIGTYTATAIATIGQNQDAIVLDGNVIRVFSRVFGVSKQFSDKKAIEKFLKPAADAFLWKGHSGPLNEALMELGALVCTPTKPQCNNCPLAKFCVTQGKNLTPETIPNIQKRKTQRKTIARCWLQKNKELLLHQSKHRRLKGVHELPLWALLQPLRNSPKCLLMKGLRTIGLCQYEEEIYQPLDQNLSLTFDDPTLHWVPIETLDKIVLSAPHKRWINRLLNSQDGHRQA